MILGKKNGKNSSVVGDKFAQEDDFRNLEDDFRIIFLTKNRGG